MSAAEKHSEAEQSVGSTRGWIALAILGIVPIVVLGIFIHRTGERAVEELIEDNNTTSAELSRLVVERQFQDWTQTLNVFAELPEVRGAVAKHEQAAVRAQLQALVEGRPHVVRAFVTDSSGLLFSDFPKAPESVGKRFDQRDWFRGVSGNWEPYVSEVYRRHAAPQLLLVAIAAPVRAPANDEIAGIIVYQVVLEELTRMLGEVEVGEGGFVYLVDHRSQVAAHPRLSFADGTAKPVRLAMDRLVEKSGDSAFDSGASIAAQHDPISGEAVLAARVPVRVGPHEWTMVAQQPSAVALDPVRELTLRIAAAGVLALLVVGALIFRLSQLHFRTRNWSERLENEVAARTEELRRKDEQLRQSQKMEAIGQLARGG